MIKAIDWWIDWLIDDKNVEKDLVKTNKSLISMCATNVAAQKLSSKPHPTQNQSGWSLFKTISTSAYLWRCHLFVGPRLFLSISVEDLLCHTSIPIFDRVSSDVRVKQINPYDIRWSWTFNSKSYFIINIFISCLVVLVSFNYLYLFFLCFPLLLVSIYFYKFLLTQISFNSRLRIQYDYS